MLRQYDAILPQLVTLYDQGRLVPFVGAGLSDPTCRKWPEFINQLAVEACSQGLGEFPDLTQVNKAKLPQWANHIVALLKRAAGDGFPSIVRRAMYRLPLDLKQA